MKITAKDKKILHELNKNARIPSSQLAKKVGISRPLLDYRLNRLLKQKTIYELYSVINPGLLGITCFRIHLRIRNISEKKYRTFAKSLFEEYPAFWVAFMSGSFDIIVDMFAKNANQFHTILTKIVSQYKEVIQSYETFVLLEVSIYEYGYFFAPNEHRGKMVLFRNEPTKKIDQKDIAILKAIKNNARAAYQEIGDGAKLSRNAAKERLKRLEQQKIIQGYKTMIDFRHLGLKSNKIFIKYNTTMIDQEKAFLAYLEQKPEVLATAKLLGKWSLDIEVHVENGLELQKFIIDLRNKFSLVEDYEIVEITEDLGIDFFPDKLAEIITETN